MRTSFGIDPRNQTSRDFLLISVFLDPSISVSVNNPISVLYFSVLEILEGFSFF